MGRQPRSGVAPVDHRRPVDVLLIRGDTTLGLRHGDDTLARALERIGCSVAQVTPDYPVTGLLRATRLAAHLGVAPDLTESLDARRATTAALRRYRPRCIVYAPGFTALLQPRSRLTAPAGIRYDSPPSLSRTGRRGAALLRRLEDRAFRSVRILLPWGVTPRPELVDALPPGPAVVSLPVPISGADGARDRDATAVTYASRNPRKKGLDLVLEAWRAGAPPGMTLLIAGISEADGRRWCRRNGVGVPPATRWVGTLAPEAWRALLASCSFYLSASRYEDHGLAQLEALALGALLVTVRSPGWFEPLTLADQLPGRLVAEAVSAPALADALGRAHRLDETARDAYRRCARGLTTAYSEATLDERLRTEVLPLLLPVQETVCR